MCRDCKLVVISGGFVLISLVFKFQISEIAGPLRSLCLPTRQYDDKPLGYALAKFEVRGVVLFMVQLEGDVSETAPSLILPGDLSHGITAESMFCFLLECCFIFAIRART